MLHCLSTGRVYAVLRTLMSDKEGVEVVLASCVQDNSSVAIKVTSKLQQKERWRAPVLTAQARAEVAALTRLAPHENTVGLVEAAEDERAVYAVFPYLPGGDLCDRMMAAKQGRCEETAARRILLQVARALRHMKIQGYSHG